MNPIQINVSVQLGLNKELYDLIKPIAENLLSGSQNVTAPAAAPVVEPKTKKKTATEKKPAEQPAAVSTEVEQPEAAPATVETAEKEYTEEDIRAAMDRTRRRIEGENYKEKPDSDGYKQWHRALTGWFKNTAALFGSDKPSTLPDSESRGKFIRCCDAVIVDNGELTEPAPF